METKLISIKQNHQNNQIFEVILLIGNNLNRFNFSIEISKIGEHQVKGVRGEKKFLQEFLFNQDLAVKIYQVILQVDQGETFDFPIEIGEFSTEKTNLISV
jgi:hypothetical protein